MRPKEGERLAHRFVELDEEENLDAGGGSGVSGTVVKNGIVFYCSEVVELEEGGESGGRKGGVGYIIVEKSDIVE